jgi:methionyl-tRNA synthetase
MSTAKNYLLTGAAPTPNGRLHLGHVGAQFLKLDVLKRHARRAGGNATLLFSVDAFDNPITYTARQAGVTEEEICRVYYDGIVSDLENVAIDCDVFLDTTVGEGRDLIEKTTIELDAVLAGRKVAVTEKIPYSRRTGSPVTGRFLTGECPACGRRMHGYSCDPCGLYMSADDIRDARAADPADILDWREVTNHFIRTGTREVRDYLDGLVLSEVVRGRAEEIAGSILADEYFLARWTASEPWGIGTGVPGQVYFNRMLITLAEQVAFGEITKEKLGLRHNPFEEGSDVVTVLAYGTDNLGGFLIENSALALATERYRPFDHHLVSEFYLLGGEKQSTSRPHCLWVEDMAALDGFSRDGLRAHMASIATPDVEVDVSLSDLTAFMRSLAATVDRVAAAASSTVDRTVDRAVVGRAEETLDGQAKALELEHIDLPKVWQSTEEWLDRARSTGQYTSLACFAVVASPLVPDIASKVWGLLGRAGDPDRAGLRRLISDGN